MGAPFHLHPFDADPVDAPLDLSMYEYGDELTAHPMREFKHSPFWSGVIDHVRNVRGRIDVALGGLALLGFAWVAIRVAAALIVGHHS